MEHKAFSLMTALAGLELSESHSRELYDYSYEEEGEETEPTLTLGAYFGDLMFYLGFWGIFFLALGCWEAYKIASTET